MVDFGFKKIFKDSGKKQLIIRPLNAIFGLDIADIEIRHLEPEKVDPGQFIYKFSLREDETHEQMSRALRFAFMEVARFNKAKDDCETFEERFLYLMKNLPTFVEKPELWDDPYFNEFMEQAEFASMSFEEQEAYIASMKQKWDYDNSIDFAEQKGEEKKAAEIARRMLEKEMSITDIVEITGLTEEQVKNL